MCCKLWQSMTAVEFLEPDIGLMLHDAAIAAYGGNPGLRDQGLFESAMLRARNKLAYAGEAADLYDLAAAYAFGLVRNHAFNDGNKRTAWAVAVTFLSLNGVELKVSKDAVLAAIIGLATNALSEEGFAVWLRAPGQPSPGSADP